MKKGIEVTTGYDKDGTWRLNVEKKKGKLTLEEIKEAAKEYEWDYYLMLLDCYHDEDDVQGYGEEPEGDLARLYRAEDLFKEELIE